MNPRLFCRESPYQKALLLTYSFDPVFFEQVVLHDLRAGRSGDILVVGDRDQIEAATQAAVGQLLHLGKHYLLACSNQAGSFHPKVLLRLGAKDGAIMLGSGNLTSSGWGGNKELGAAWMLGPGHADSGAWLHPFLGDVMSWCSGELEADAVRRMRDVPWLGLTPVPATVASPVLHSRHGNTLASALAQRWAGRQFDEVRILTGSTDESGAFLRWAHATFGIKRAVVALTPAMARFVPEKLEGLPFELRLIAAPSDRTLHAKLYWFDGAAGPGAVMGSANCSAAAWLLPPDRGGNVETVVVYDAPDMGAFDDALKMFDEPSHAPVELLVPKQIAVDSQPAARREYELVSLRWDDSTRSLLAVVRPAPPADWTVELIHGGKRLSMTPPAAGGEYWKCELPEGIGSETAFASVRLRQGDRIWTTPPRWIDDLSALRDAGQSAWLVEPFRGLERSATSAEQRQMLDDLQEVARTLFNDSASFPDPGFGPGRREKTDDGAPAAPVNPNDLICHLGEPQDSLQQLGSSSQGSLSLTGILRLLFDAEGDVGGPGAAARDDHIDEGQLPEHDDEPDSVKQPGNGTAEQQVAPIEERYRERLAAEMETFLGEISSSVFAERCTATQMVQAVAFPLAVALRGQRRGWVSPALAEKWGLEVFSILFRGRRSGAGGLLRTVEDRYAQNGQTATFREVVGGGTLWIVLVATLGNAQWQGVGTDIDKAIALREVFTAQPLLASARPDSVAGLLGKIRIDDARSFLAVVAPTATRLLNQIEDVLRPSWEAEIRAQTGRSMAHRTGDLLWREGVGWAICLADASAGSDLPIWVRLRGVEKNIARGYYVNVTELAARGPDLKAMVRDLRACVGRRE